MASMHIEKRTRANGEVRYRTTIIVKERGKIVHRVNKTFTKKAHAQTWGKNQITEIEQLGVNACRPATIGRLIELYQDERDIWDNLGRTTKITINALAKYDIAKVQAGKLSTSDLIKFCKLRRDVGASPATIYNDITFLRSMMKKAKPVFNIDANISVFHEAIPILKDMNLIGSSQKRTRRPTSEEIEALRAELANRKPVVPRKTPPIPYVDIFDFSILSCMRLGEVCRIRWEDLNEEHKTILVRDRKDPKKKAGNHMIVPLLGGAFDIVMRQPRDYDRIFPHEPRAVSNGFALVRKKLGIEDLRYHDLRREGASRLFEKGYSIEEVAQVTGHKRLETLWTVYTQLFPHKLHDKQV